MIRKDIRNKRLQIAAKLAAIAALLIVTLAAPGGAAIAAPSGLVEKAMVQGFPSVKQWYHLSCEYAAAAAITLYHGKLVSQRDFIAQVPKSPNPHVGFRGNINGAWGGTTNYGIYAEPLVPVLEAYGYKAEVFYGGTARLKSELAAGRPVVVWMTGKRGTFQAKYETYQGESFKLVPYEHAVVAYGYDAGGIWIMDVGDGNKYYYAWTNFITRWNNFDQMSLAITPIED